MQSVGSPKINRKSGDVGHPCSVTGQDFDSRDRVFRESEVEGSIHRKSGVMGHPTFVVD